jgi:hypothetical protein
MDKTLLLNDLLKKYYDNYKDGKKLFNIDKEKSYDYFKNSLSILENLKNKYPEKIHKYKDIIEESENECLKYLSLTVDSVINSENKYYDKISIKELLSSIECGDLDLIKSLKPTQINFKEKINGNTILHYAVKYGDTGFLKHAFKLGARVDTTNNNGNTLLEFACFEQDPNMINFLVQYGANMKKHLYFRDGGKKYINSNDSIDICNIIKIILAYENDINLTNNNIHNKFKILKNLIDHNEKIHMNDFTYTNLLNGLYNLLNKLPEESAISYLEIILEELSYIIQYKLGCPPNKLEIICISLVPFIEYNFNISLDWVFSLELKYLIINLIKKKKINNLNIKNELIENIWNIYIKKEIIQEDYLGCLISQWIAKIKV